MLLNRSKAFHVFQLLLLGYIEFKLSSGILSDPKSVAYKWRHRPTPPFYKTLITNPNHVLRSLCTLRPTIQYHLRPRPHPFNLPVSDNRNFLSRLMFLGTY